MLPLMQLTTLNCPVQYIEHTSDGNSTIRLVLLIRRAWFALFVFGYEIDLSRRVVSFSSELLRFVGVGYTALTPNSIDRRSVVRGYFRTLVSYCRVPFTTRGLAPACIPAPTAIPTCYVVTEN